MRFPLFIMVLAICLTGWMPASFLQADSPEPPAAESEQKETATSEENSQPQKKTDVLEGLQLQPGDEPLKRIERDQPAADAEEDQKRRDAMAAYMTGTIQRSRGEFDAALASYLKAIEYDPAAIEPYKSVLPILLQKRQTTQAHELTLSAAEHHPEGFDLVRTLAEISVRQDDVDAGLKLLQDGLKVSSLKAGSVEELKLHRSLGQFYRIKNEPGTAAEHYEKVFHIITDETADETLRQELLGDAGQTFDEFGEAFLAAKKPDLALQAFGEASKHREAKPGLHSYNLATVFQQTGQPEEALKALQEYFDAQLQNRGRGAYELLNQLLTELERKEELLPLLREMREKDQHNDVLRYYLADELLAGGDLAAATELYTNGRDSVADPRAMVGLISIYRQNKEPAKLMQVLTDAYKNIPRTEEEQLLEQMAPEVKNLAMRFDEEINALIEDEEGFGAVLSHARALQAEEEPKVDFFDAYVLGKLSIEAKRTDDVLHFYRYAISMRNDPPAQLYRELGWHLVFDTENHDEAINVLNEAIKHPSGALQREKAMFLWMISFPYQAKGDSALALEVLKEAQKLRPNQALFMYQEAAIYAQNRDWDEAVQRFEKVIEKFPDEERIVLGSHFQISNIYVQQGEMDKGEKILEEVLKNHPDDPQVNNDLGYLWADRGKNLEQAKAMIEKALEAEPENHAYLDSLGWVLYRLEKYEEALVPLQKAAELNQDSTIVDHLGDVLFKLGREEEARKSWQDAYESEKKKNHPDEKMIGDLQKKLQIDPEAADADSSEPNQQTEEQ